MVTIPSTTLRSGPYQPKMSLPGTIAPEIYTFGRQNRPGILACPVDSAVHQPPGNIFFRDQSTHQIIMSDLHYPVTLSSVAGESNSGLRDGRRVCFKIPQDSVSKRTSFSSVIVVMHQSGSLTFLDWCQGRKMTLFS